MKNKSISKKNTIIKIFKTILEKNAFSAINNKMDNTSDNLH